MENEKTKFFKNQTFCSLKICFSTSTVTKCFFANLDFDQSLWSLFLPVFFFSHEFMFMPESWRPLRRLWVIRIRQELNVWSESESFRERTITNHVTFVTSAVGFRGFKLLFSVLLASFFTLPGYNPPRGNEAWRARVYWFCVQHPWCAQTL